MKLLLVTILLSSRSEIFIFVLNIKDFQCRSDKHILFRSPESKISIINDDCANLKLLGDERELPINPIPLSF